MIPTYNGNAVPKSDVPQRILARMKDGEDVQIPELVRRLGVSGSTVGFHLRRLCAQGLVTRFRRSYRTYFRKGAAVRQNRPEATIHFAGYRDPELRGYANW